MRIPQANLDTNDDAAILGPPGQEAPAPALERRLDLCGGDGIGLHLALPLELVAQHLVGFAQVEVARPQEPDANLIVDWRVRVREILLRTRAQAHPPRARGTVSAVGKGCAWVASRLAGTGGGGQGL